MSKFKLPSNISTGLIKQWQYQLYYFAGITTSQNNKLLS